MLNHLKSGMTSDDPVLEALRVRVFALRKGSQPLRISVTAQGTQLVGQQYRFVFGSPSPLPAIWVVDGTSNSVSQTKRSGKGTNLLWPMADWIHGSFAAQGLASQEARIEVKHGDNLFEHLLCLEKRKAARLAIIVDISVKEEISKAVGYAVERDTTLSLSIPQSGQPTTGSLAPSAATTPISSAPTFFTRSFQPAATPGVVSVPEIGFVQDGSSTAEIVSGSRASRERGAALHPVESSHSSGSRNTIARNLSGMGRVITITSDASAIGLQKEVDTAPSMGSARSSGQTTALQIAAEQALSLLNDDFTEQGRENKRRPVMTLSGLISVDWD